MRRRIIGVVGIMVGLSSAAAARAQPVGDVGEQRAATQMELKLNPPRLVGQKTDLRIENGAMIGKLEGDKYNARVSSDRVLGVGPFGKIDVAITTRKDEVHFDGVWNGQPLHTSVGPRGVTGRAFRLALPGNDAVQSCEFKIDEPKGNVLSGEVACLGGNPPLRLSVQTPGRFSLLDENTAVLLMAFLVGPPLPPVGPHYWQ